MSSNDSVDLPPDFMDRYFEVTIKTVLWSCLIGILTVCGAIVSLFFYKALIVGERNVQWLDLPVAFILFSFFWFIFGKGWLICIAYSFLFVAVLRKTFLNKSFIFGLPIGHLVLVVSTIVSLFFMPDIMLG